MTDRSSIFVVYRQDTVGKKTPCEIRGTEVDAKTALDELNALKAKTESGGDFRYQFQEMPPKVRTAIRMIQREDGSDNRGYVARFDPSDWAAYDLWEAAVNLECIDYTRLPSQDAVEEEPAAPAL